MYQAYFGLDRAPFSIAPDPRYLYMSQRHKEALAHLLFGLRQGGGFVVLSGEIGAGKTTICRCLLNEVPEGVNVGYLLYPRLTVPELLHAICDEFRVDVPEKATLKDIIDALNRFLLKAHAVGQDNVLIIDEAQGLSADVLEQLRLLTNLETDDCKLLQIVLIGQPELRDLLARPELAQLSQRVIARFHLDALTEFETAQYIRHRLQVAGLSTAPPFDVESVRRIHAWSRGVPRRVNLLCDRALLGTFVQRRRLATPDIIDAAAREVFPGERLAATPWWPTATAAAFLLAALVGATTYWQRLSKSPSALPATAAATAAPAPAAAPAVPPAVAATPPAPAAPEAAAPGELAVPSGSVQRSEAQAWRDLATLWQSELPVGSDPCSAVRRDQLLCHRATLTLAEIRRLDRPGIVTLRDQGGLPVYALLTGLTRERATLRIGGTTQAVTLSSFARLWRGEFSTLWRTPEGYESALALGSRGPVVDRLAAQLAQAQGRPPPPADVRFDAELHARLLAFQLSQDLVADGLAGPTTFMRLNHAAGVAEPTLGAER